MKMQFLKIKLFMLAAMICCFNSAGTGQTGVYTYQGRFVDATVPQPTNGTYEMQFRLYDAAQNGLEIGNAQTIQAVQVVNGIFTVQLDAENSFKGADVYLEISVRPAGSSIAPTTLAPRQQVTSAPYAVQSRHALTAKDAEKLGGLPASSYTQNTDGRLADERNPTAGSANYVQNQNSAAQTAANFNISGSGTADTFNAAMQFNLAGNRVLSVKGNANLFAGANAGTANANGNSNTFVGSFSGNANTNGFNNAFFGTDAGRSNQGDSNSFFGRSSGYDTTTGSSNSFFGLDAGRYNQTGSNNAFFGKIAGNKNNADNNSFFGFYAGGLTTTGGGNSFFGYNTGLSNVGGSNNTLIGTGANVGANNLTFATAVGAGAVVAASNTIALGRSDGSDTVRIFGLGAAGSTVLCRNALSQIASCAAGVGTVNGDDFIKNQNTVVQSGDFNIGGSGRVSGFLSGGAVTTETFYRIGNQIVLNTPNATSLVAGVSANHNVAGVNNTFFGYKAGAAAGNTGESNSFFGTGAGQANTNGNSNSFFGNGAGALNTTGRFNTFIGDGAGSGNLSGSSNTVIGLGADIIGSSNGFYGSGNSIVGVGATAQGSSNTVIGYKAKAEGSDSAAIGDGAEVTGEYSLSMGYNTRTYGDKSIAIGFAARVSPQSSASSYPSRATAIGADAVADTDNQIVLGTLGDTVLVNGKILSAEVRTASLTVTGNTLKLSVLGQGTASGNRVLCLNSFNLVAECPYIDGDDGKMSTAGPAGRNGQLKAQAAQLQTQTAQIEQQQKEIEKQGGQIEAQRKQIQQQQLLIENLRKLVCASNPTAEVCRP